jgi:hypothetical protein
MLAFAQASRGRRVNVQHDAGGLNVKAYAVLGEDKRLWVSLINKETSRDAEVTIAGARSFAGGRLMRLVAPSLESKEDVTLGGAAVTPGARWAVSLYERVAARRDDWVLELPAASAALVTLGD